MENQQLAIEVVRQYLEHEFPGRDVADFRDKAYHGHTFRVDDETGTRVAGLTQPTARGGRAPGRGAVEASHPDQGRIRRLLTVATSGRDPRGRRRPSVR